MKKNRRWRRLIVKFHTWLVRLRYIHVSRFRSNALCLLLFSDIQRHFRIDASGEKAAFVLDQLSRVDSIPSFDLYWFRSTLTTSFGSRSKCRTSAVGSSPSNNPEAKTKHRFREETFSRGFHDGHRRPQTMVYPSNARLHVKYCQFCGVDFARGSFLACFPHMLRPQSN